MLDQWADIGRDEEEFWRSTPLQVARVFKAEVARRRREHEQRVWLAWHIAALGRVKKFPKLTEMMGDTRTRFQDPEERWRMFAPAKGAR